MTLWFRAATIAESPEAYAAFGSDCGLALGHAASAISAMVDATSQIKRNPEVGN